MTVAVAAEARARVDRIKVGVEAVWHLIVESYQARDWEALGYATWDEMCTREFGTSRLRLPREERAETVQSLRDAGLSLRAIEAATGVSRPTIIKDLRDEQVVNPLPPRPEVIEPEYEPSGMDEFTVNRETGEVVEDETYVCAHCGGYEYTGDGDYPPDQCRCDVSLGTQQKDVADAEDEPLTEAECEAIEEDRTAQKITGLDGKRYTPSAPRSPQRKPITDEFRGATLDLGRVLGRISKLAADDRFKKNAGQISQFYLHDLARARDALQRVIDQLPN